MRIRVLEYFGVYVGVPLLWEANEYARFGMIAYETSACCCYPLGGVFFGGSEYMFVEVILVPTLPALFVYDSCTSRSTIS